MEKPTPQELLEEMPPSRWVLDLDQPLQLQALLESLQLLQEDAPPEVRQKSLQAWRGQLLVRLGYLLGICSLTRSGSQQSDLQQFAQLHQEAGQVLLHQARLREVVARNNQVLQRSPG